MPYILVVSPRSAFILSAATEMFARSIYATRYSSIRNGISLRFSRAIVPGPVSV